MQFYATEADYVERLSAYVADGLEDGDGIVAVLTDVHRRALLASLQGHGCNAKQAMQRGRLKLLDATEAVGLFFSSGPPTGAKLGEIVGPLLDEVSAASRNGRVRAIGEVVSVLASNGRMTDALRLERAWTAAQETRQFSLLCLYRLADFPHVSDQKAFSSVCDAHDRVFPSTRPEVSCDPVKGALRVAQLEQLAASAELETSLRRIGERELQEAHRAIALPSNFPNAFPSPGIIREVDSLLTKIVQLTHQAGAEPMDNERTVRLLREIRVAAQRGTDLMAATSLVKPEAS